MSTVDASVGLKRGAAPPTKKARSEAGAGGERPRSLTAGTGARSSRRGCAGAEVAGLLVL